MKNPDSQTNSTRTDDEITSSLSRRDFLKTAGVLGIYAAIGIPAWAASSGVDPESLRICNGTGESDCPAICAGPNGSAWAVWQTYDASQKADRLLVAQFKDNLWARPIPVPSVSGDLYKPACAMDNSGKLWVVWSEQREDNWDLWSITLNGDLWTSPVRITEEKGPDFAPRMVTAPDGAVVMVWQSRHDANYQVLMAHASGNKWGKIETVSTGEGNNWFPDVAVASDGAISVVWDSYRNGNYDVYLRQKKQGTWGDEILVAGSADFEAYARVSVDKDGAAWIAYEQREEKWGKDWGSSVPASVRKGTLNGISHAKIRCYKDGKFYEVAPFPDHILKGSPWGGDRNPIVRMGNEGRLWLFIRRTEPELFKLPWGGFANKLFFSFWRNYAFYLDGNKWSEPISCNDTNTRVDSDVDCLVLPNGGLLAVWNSENRGPAMKRIPKKSSIYSTVISKPDTPVTSPRITEINLPTTSKDEAAIQEAKDVRRARDYHATVGGKKCRLYRGDLHRHTDISFDGISDCSITDMYRYAIDAASLDFVSPNDHNHFCGIDLEYVRWRTQKITDVFNAPPYFITIHGYERSVNFPHGHHNVLWPHRGEKSLPLDNAKDDLERLYAYVHQTGGLCIPHTTGTEAGTDWHAHDPEIEPVVEICQGARNSYEYEGAPRTDKPATSNKDGRGGYKKEGFVWEAWKKGYKLGVIASSDHGSTHVSYANVYAPEGSRESIFKSILQRHTYGSTDNIILDFRTDKTVQGEEAKINHNPKFKIHVFGTGPIQQLVIFKNFEIAHEMKSDDPQINMTWEDDSPKKGENHYYVRVLQTNGELAWSSPIWLTLS